MPRHRLLLLLPALLASLSIAPARAQASADTVFTLARMLDAEMVSEPRIAPDGGQILFTRRWVDVMADKWTSAIWIMDVDGSHQRFLAKGGSAVWSPDGTRIAYLAEGEPGGAQVYALWLDRAGAPTQVTHDSFILGDLQWSPDGKWLGFSKFVPAPKPWSIDLPAPPAGAKWTPPPRFVDRLHYRTDRLGYTEPGNIHLFLVPSDGGTARQLTRGDWSVGGRFDGIPIGTGWSWSPDGKSIVTDGYQGDDADLNYRDSHLYLVDVTTGAVKQLTSDRGTWSKPEFSPDGRMISFTGYKWVRQTYRVADLYTMRADGSGITYLSGGLDREPRERAWAPDGSGIYFTAEDRGSVQLFFASTGGGTKAVTSGPQVLSLGGIARTGVAVGVRSRAQEPGDVVRFTLKQPGEIVRLTAVNDDIFGRTRFGAVEEVWYPSSGGARIQGWIVKPPGFDPAKKYPMLLEIHGGPHGMYTAGFDYFMQSFAGLGYVVLYTNPRGSTGYGTAFGNAIDLAYPSVDYDDLMAGVDTLIGRGYVDTKRLFVSGCSGGGVLSSWVIGHTTRFAAAAVRCPVTDWLSFAGHTDVPLFTGNFFPKPFWEDPLPWLKQSSLMYVGNVTTPTLLMTGVLDLRTPMPQTEEYFAALKVRGVPAALLRFEGEWHGTESLPSNFLRTILYMDSWFKKYSTTSRGPS
jgi:dipeptidyl aminopeptidase/acylaminoacyl peptidase